MTAAIRHAVPVELAPEAMAGFDHNRRVIDLAGITMGTRWRVRVAAPAGLDAGALQQRIATRLDRLVEEMSHWTTTSRLATFNASPAGAWTTLPRDFAAVIAAGLTVAAASDGAFDPAIGRLTDLWGLGPRPRFGDPTTDEIMAARAVSSWRRLAFDFAGTRLRQPGGLWLDLSGIAKGHAADAIAAMLADVGLAHALVEVGGECVGRGLRPDGDPWWVELETPPGLSLPPLRVALHQLAVATSGRYVRGAHTLDPRTGCPVTHDTIAASVLHRSAMSADAWATALMVASPEAAMAMAISLSLPARLIAASGHEWISPAFGAMLEG